MDNKPQYCIKYNLSAKTVRNMVKGKINNELIGLYYDCSKSLKENLSTFKELNLKVGKSKLYEWCKENNIPTNIKNNQSTKNTVGLYLYNPISGNSRIGFHYRNPPVTNYKGGTTKSSP